MKNMFCPRCGKQLTDTDEICPQCGFRLDKPPATPNDVTVQQNKDFAANTTNGQLPQTKSSSANTFAGLGIFAGVVLIILGIVKLNGIEDMRFGADFYTEAYKMIATCARALYGMYIISGVVLILNNGYKICKNKSKRG